MKPVEEIEISPTPWGAVIPDHPWLSGYIVCNANIKEGDTKRKIIASDVHPKNARMLAAAPKMYENAYSVLNNLLLHLQCPEETIRMNRAEVAAMAKELHDALAEASGEVSNG